MNYQTVLNSLRSTLATDQEKHSECVDRVGRLSEEYEKAQAAETAAAKKMQDTKDTILTIESLLQKQLAEENASYGTEGDGTNG